MPNCVNGGRFCILYDRTNILAIESSCDDMAAAVIADGQIVASVISSQLEHVDYGGVVPEIASRAHMRTIAPVVSRALRESGVEPSDLSAVAVTNGPGLAGSLLVGVSFAKTFALGLGIPAIAVNHLEGHIFSAFLASKQPEYPFLCLIVSGGHTLLLRVSGAGQYEKLGATLDDAAGEAFDKVGSLFGFEYPAGPTVDECARKGDPQFHTFPRTSMAGLNFSFSGLKTSVLYFLNAVDKTEREQYIATHLADLCASFQAAVVDQLIMKLQEAVAMTGINRVVIVGGVSANSLLRAEATRLANQSGGELFLSPLEYCTDNAAMIAAAAAVRFAESQFSDLTFEADANAVL